MLMRLGQERKNSVNVPEIRKKFSTRFRGAKALLDGFGSSGEEETMRSEIDRVILLHTEAEMTNS